MGKGGYTRDSRFSSLSTRKTSPRVGGGDTLTTSRRDEMLGHVSVQPAPRISKRSLVLPLSVSCGDGRHQDDNVTRQPVDERTVRRVRLRCFKKGGDEISFFQSKVPTRKFPFRFLFQVSRTSNVIARGSACLPYRSISITYLEEFNRIRSC